MLSLMCSMYVHVRSDVSNIFEIFDIWRLTCSNRIHMLGDVSNIFEIFDIWLVTCLIMYTYDGLRVEYF